MDNSAKKKMYQLKKTAREKMAHNISSNDLSGINFKITDEWISGQLAVSKEEISSFEKSLIEDFAEVNIDCLFQDCRKRVIESIITPLGLGKFVSMYDRVGGNVDTIHNSRQIGEDGNPIGTEKFKKKYAERGEYDSNKYHSDPQYKNANRDKKNKRDQGRLNDDYSGEKILPNQPYDQDHVISAKEIHDDGGAVLSGLKGVELANDDSNLKATNRAINRNKGAQPMSDFVLKLEKTRVQRQTEIRELKSKPDLTDQEQKKLEKLETCESADVELMMKADEIARNQYNKKINQTYYSSKEFCLDLTKTSAIEGVRIGIKQAIGLLLVDLSNALLDELIDSYRHGFIDGVQSESLIKSIKMRLQKVANVVITRWKNIVVAFKDGALSGMLSNIITTLINTFLTTAKNIVRIIREGAFVLVRAVKIILFPPKEMSIEESWDAALKLIVSSSFTLGGIVIEEYFTKAFISVAWLGPFTSTLSVICAGILTGVATSYALYTIDKLDPFGVHDRKKRCYIRQKIQKIGTAHIEKLDGLCAEYDISD